jgi:hypothetical protein
MSYVWLGWLADALRAEGCRVSEVSGWSSRGRPSSAGSFAPYGVCWHHTGTTASYGKPAPTLQTCINGRSDLPGPLCHVLIGYDGLCHIVAAGRANHAGECNGYGPFAAGDGNAQLVGFEIDYNGTQPMSPEQYDAAARASSGCLKRFAHNQDYVTRHEETSTTGKWDTGGVTGPQIRDTVAEYLEAGGDEMVKPTDVVGTDSDGTNLTMGEMSARLNWLYQQWLEAGSLNQQLDRIEQALKDLK